MGSGNDRVLVWALVYYALEAVHILLNFFQSVAASVMSYNSCLNPPYLYQHTLNCLIQLPLKLPRFYSNPCCSGLICVKCRFSNSVQNIGTLK